MLPGCLDGWRRVRRTVTGVEPVLRFGWAELAAFQEAHPEVTVEIPPPLWGVWRAWIPCPGDETSGRVIAAERLTELLDRLEAALRLDGAEPAADAAPAGAPLGVDGLPEPGCGQQPRRSGPHLVRDGVGGQRRPGRDGARG